MGNKKERDSRIDLVRVIAMLCIVMHHCIVNDFGLQQILRGGGAGGYNNIQIIMLIVGNAIVIVGVNIFFLLSGWCRIHFKWEKIIELIIKVYIIFGIIQMIGLFTGRVELNIESVKQLLDPLDLY